MTSLPHSSPIHSLILPCKRLPQMTKSPKSDHQAKLKKLLHKNQSIRHLKLHNCTQNVLNSSHNSSLHPTACQSTPRNVHHHRFRPTVGQTSPFPPHFSLHSDPWTLKTINVTDSWVNTTAVPMTSANQAANIKSWHSSTLPQSTWIILIRRLRY